MKILDGKYNLRPFTEDDEKGVLKLWKIAFNSTMSPELFRWKYLENPYSQAMLLCVADNDEIITFYGGIPYLFQYSKRVVPAVHLMDIMSHPMHRQNRVFEKTARQFMSYFCTPENLLLMYGFPGEFHYSIGERILNYRKVTQSIYLTCSLNSAEDIDDFSLLRVPPGELNGFSMELVKSIEENDLWFDSLWAECTDDYPFAIVRDSKFVNWRFFNHPEREYTVLKFVLSSGQSSPSGKSSSSSKPAADLNNQRSQEAYAVLQISGSKASIIDMLMPDSALLFRRVLSSTIDYLAPRGIKDIETWLPENHFLATHALSFGFKSQKEPIGIIPTVSLFDHSPSLEWVKANMYHNMGDGDLL